MAADLSPYVGLRVSPPNHNAPENVALATADLLT